MHVIGGFNNNNIINRTANIQDYAIMEEIRKSCTITPIEESKEREFKFIDINVTDIYYSNTDNHSHGHNHSNNHGHSHNYTYNHSHSHNHDHSNSHGHSHNPFNINTESINRNNLENQENDNQILNIEDNEPKEGNDEHLKEEISINEPNIQSEEFKEQRDGKRVNKYKENVIIEMSLREMDRLHEAYFTEWIRDESNLEQSQRHVTRIAMEYPVESIVGGLKWLMDGWSINGMALIFHALLLRQSNYYNHKKNQNENHAKKDQEYKNKEIDKSNIKNQNQNQNWNNYNDKNNFNFNFNNNDNQFKSSIINNQFKLEMENWKWCFVLLEFINEWSSNDQVLLITIIINDHVKKESKKNQKRIKPILMQLVEMVKMIHINPISPSFESNSNFPFHSTHSHPRSISSSLLDSFNFPSHSMHSHNSSSSSYSPLYHYYSSFFYYFHSRQEKSFD